MPYLQISKLSKFRDYKTTIVVKSISFYMNPEKDLKVVAEPIFHL